MSNYYFNYYSKNFKKNVYFKIKRKLLFNLVKRQNYYYFLFLSATNKQTHIDSVNQTGSSAPIWTTNEGCFLAQRARLSALEFNVRGIWISCELWKLPCRILISSR